MAQIKVVSLVKAKAGQSAEEFAVRWKEQHTKLTGKYKNMKKYVINIPNAQWHKDMQRGAIWDGSAEMYWDSYEDMIEDLTSPEGQAAIADGNQFLEYVADIYTEEHIIFDKM